MRPTYNAIRSYKIDIRNSSEAHHLHVNEWGEAGNSRVILCLHGLTRCSLDFSVLGSFFAESYRVICPDLVGRGQSSWLENKFLYQVPLYIQDIIFLLSKLDLKDVRIIGTSLGGILGMILASHPEKYLRDNVSKEITEQFVSMNTWRPDKLKALVLNDVGAVVNFSDLLKLKDEINSGCETYLTIIEAEKQIRLTMEKSLGAHSDLEWKLLTSFYTRYDPKKKCFVPHYDPAILNPYDLPALVYDFTKFGLDTIPELNLYSFYDSISAPTLLVRGLNSPILGKKVALEMTKRGPMPRLVEVEGVGHAPTLMHLHQLQILEKFLKAHE